MRRQWGAPPTVMPPRINSSENKGRIPLGHPTVVEFDKMGGFCVTIFYKPQD